MELKDIYTEKYLRENLLNLAKSLGLQNYTIERTVWEDNECLMLTCITESFEKIFWDDRDGKDMDWQEYFPLPEHLDEIENFAANTDIKCNYFYGLTKYNSFGDCCLAIVLYFDKNIRFPNPFDDNVRKHQRRYDKIRKQLIGKGE